MQKNMIFWIIVSGFFVGDMYFASAPASKPSELRPIKGPVSQVLFNQEEVFNRLAADSNLQKISPSDDWNIKKAISRLAQTKMSADFIKEKDSYIIWVARHKDVVLYYMPYLKNRRVFSALFWIEKDNKAYVFQLINNLKEGELLKEINMLKKVISTDSGVKKIIDNASVPYKALQAEKTTLQVSPPTISKGSSAAPRAATLSQEEKTPEGDIFSIFPAVSAVLDQLKPDDKKLADQILSKLSSQGINAFTAKTVIDIGGYFDPKHEYFDVNNYPLYYYVIPIKMSERNAYLYLMRSPTEKTTLAIDLRFSEKDLDSIIKEFDTNLNRGLSQRITTAFGKERETKEKEESLACSRAKAYENMFECEVFNTYEPPVIRGLASNSIFQGSIGYQKHDYATGKNKKPVTVILLEDAVDLTAKSSKLIKNALPQMTMFIHQIVAGDISGNKWEATSDKKIYELRYSPTKWRIYGFYHGTQDRDYYIFVYAGDEKGQSADINKAGNIASDFDKMDSQGHRLIDLFLEQVSQTQTECN